MYKNIFLKIEYLGTNYFGFQLQDKKGKREISVQGVLEKAIRRLFKEKIRITSASRTDKGVHAKGQAVNFKVDTKISLKNIKNALNTFLPSDVRVKTVKRVPLGFHARFWAKSKIYRYVILNRKEPTVFWENFSWHVARPLNISNIKRISKKLVGKKDFSLFAKEAKSYRDCVRKITNITIKKRGGFIYVDIEANGFLRNMVRNIVSFLVQVGEGKTDIRQAVDILKKKAKYSNKPAPAKGLYLVKVKY
ncbi:MAG: tRNA pseudouridine(38-40) synthase TruA [Candidatus Omnitrophota bacterium]|nr:tRNA pseudouridine(38-40) synthase TruA [Candidatus Omnitrophota bacterium]